MKKVLTIQDISGVGKCSLTVALPVLSAAGLETCVLPTAVLSCHTGFQSFTFHDLTGEIPAIEDSWETEGFQFDAVYNGYLGSPEQVHLVEDIVSRFLKPGGIYVADPAMADHGKLYPGFDADFPQAMQELCTHADICIPNLTEDCLITGTAYVEEASNRKYIATPLMKPHEQGAAVPILTGVSFDPSYLGAMAYDSEQKSFVEYYTKKEPNAYHGTGDLFASSVVGALVRGRKLPDAIRIATEFTHASIVKTLQDPEPNWYGVNFEEAIPYFLRLLSD